MAQIGKKEFLNFNQIYLGTVHQSARECNLVQIKYTESIQPLITKLAYVWESEIVTVIHILARHGCIDALRYFIGLGYDPDMITKIKKYIEQRQITLDGEEITFPHIWMNDSQLTPLMYAAKYSKSGELYGEVNLSEIVSFLIESGADIDRINNYSNLDITSGKSDFKYTSLMYAARSNSADIVTILLEAGANYSLTSHTGKTARQISIDYDFPDVTGAIDDFI